MPLPQFETPLLGRGPELALLSERMTEHAAVTVIGPGGVGKTRLAVAWATSSDAEAVFVDASVLRDGTELIPTITAALERPLEPGKGGRLLLLDNLEHLPEAAEAVLHWRAQAPWLRLLCTSRAPLGYVAEVNLPLQPLKLGMGHDDGAVALFIERARNRRPHWQPDRAERELIAEICAWLDGLPLAVELVAAQSHAVPLETMLRRLQQRQPLSKRDPGRHGSLERVFAWSAERLSPAHREALAALSLLTGSFTNTFAASYLNALGLETSAPQTLTQLGLVTLDGARYRVLETVRGYAQAPLGKEQRQACMRAYGVTVSALVRDCFPDSGLRPNARLEAVMRLMDDWSHLVTLMAWWIEQQQWSPPVEVLLRLPSEIMNRVEHRARLSWYEQCLEHWQQSDERQLRLIQLFCSFLGLYGDERMRHWSQQGFKLAQALGDRKSEAGLQKRLGDYLEQNNELEAASHHTELALELFRLERDRVGIRQALATLAVVRLEQGRFTESIELVSEAQHLLEPDDAAGFGSSYGILAGAYLGLRQPREALRCIAANLDYAERYQVWADLSLSCVDLCGLAVEAGQLGTATELYAVLERRFRQTGESVTDYLKPETLAALPRLDAAHVEAPREPDEVVVRRALGALEAIFSRRSLLDLNEREHQLLALLLTGKSNKQIALDLKRSERTVRNRLGELYAKLGTNSRTETIRLAMSQDF